MGWRSVMVDVVINGAYMLSYVVRASQLVELKTMEDGL